VSECGARKRLNHIYLPQSKPESLSFLFFSRQRKKRIDAGLPFLLLTSVTVKRQYKIERRKSESLSFLFSHDNGKREWKSGLLLSHRQAINITPPRRIKMCGKQSERVTLAMRDLIENGESPSVISKRYNIHRYSITRVLVRMGYIPNPQGRPKNGTFPLKLP